MSKLISKTSDKTVKASVAFRFIPLLLITMICSLPAYAEYSFQVVIPPGAGSAQGFGINNAGDVIVLSGDEGGGTFVYDIKTGEYTDLGNEITVLEISNSGVMVGNVDMDCAIRDKKGNITTFYPPSLPANYQCQARGINSNGKVSGYVFDGDTGVWYGFIYDPEYDTYEEFLTSPQTIAHAINAQGQNVGSVFLNADEAYPGASPGRYGYLRQEDGSVKYFAISQSRPGQTRGRGISENGLVTGWYFDPAFDVKSFVTILSAGNDFEEITLSDDEVLYQTPCDANIPDAPGPGYELFTDITASQIRNDGVVVGSCTDYYVNGTTGDIIRYSKGFIATPN